MDLDRGVIEKEELKLTMERYEHYLWIGNTFRASLEPILRLTSDRLEYLFSERNGVDGIVKTIEGFPAQYRSDSVNRLYEYLKQIRTIFGNLQNLSKEYEEEMKKEDVKPALYSIAVRKNGEVFDLSKEKGYKEFLEIVLLQKNKQARKGTCYLCGFDKVLLDPSFRLGSLLKVYVIDKKGFLSGISDNEESKLRTFTLCSNCLKKLLTGDGFIETNLRSYIGRFNLYIVPRSATEIRLLKKWADYIKDRVGALNSYNGLIEFNQKLSDYSEFVNNEPLYSLTLIFGEREQISSFRLYGMITEIPITRMTSFTSSVSKIAREMSLLFTLEENVFNCGLAEIYRIFPLRKSKNGPVREYKPLLSLYSSLLQDSEYSRSELLKRALLFARINKFKLHSLYDIRQEKNLDVQLCNGILKFNILLKLLDKSMEVSDVQANKSEDLKSGNKIMKYFNLMGYKEWQQSLFLLGYLVGEIGSQQYNKGDEKKSILSKIDFDGIRKEKVVILSNQILKSLRDYRVLKYNEKTYADMKELLDRNLNNLYDPIMNTFYILSGYSFSTLQRIKASSANINKEDNNDE